MKTFFAVYKPYFLRIAALSYPIIIGQIGTVLMGVSDVIMIGHLDSTNLAAAGLANAIYFFITILGIGTLTAVSPLVAKANGAGHNNDTAILLRQGLLASVLLSVVISAIVFFLSENLHWFGQTPEIVALTKSYLHIINAGTFFLLLFIAAKQFSDGLSFTKPAAVITITGLGVNILLCWILIYGHWGFPAYLLDGAGYATTITRVLMAAVMVTYVCLHKRYKHFIHIKEKVSGLHWLKEILRVGLPSGFQYFFEVGAFAASAVIIGWFGENALAAHQVAINLASVTYMIATGFSIGGSIAVGDAWGRKNKADLIRSGRAALIMSATFMLLMALLFAFGNHFLVSLYVKDETVAAMSASLLLIAALFQLSDGIQCVGLGVLRGIADTKVPTIITVIAYWVVGIPVGYLLAYSLDLSLYGIWYGLSIALTVSAILLTVRFFRETRSFSFAEEEKTKYDALVNDLEVRQ